jgi:hypothetical protein
LSSRKNPEESNAIVTVATGGFVETDGAVTAKPKVDWAQ